MRTIAILFVVLLAACAGPNSQDLANRPPSLSVAQAALTGGFAGGGAANLLRHGAARAEEPGGADLPGRRAGRARPAGRRRGSFERAQKIAPDDAGVLMGLGRLGLATDPLGAEALFRHVLKISPDNAPAWNDIGIARDLQGRHEDAQEAYGRALGLSPACAPPR